MPDRETDDGQSPTTPARRGGRRAGAGRPRNAETAEAILDSTLAILDRVGYGGLRIDEVARQVGVAKTTVYRRWTSKPTLVAAAAERLYLSHVDVPDTGTLRADLLALLSNSYDVLVNGRGRILAR